MTNKTVSSQGFELSFPVPDSVEEYNNLAPKRSNPCLEDAVQNTLYRSVFNRFRDRLCEALEKYSKLERVNSGTKEEPKYEAEGVYIRKVLAHLATARGLDPAAKATKDQLIKELTPLAQTVLTGGSAQFTNDKGEPETVTYPAIKFDPTEREPGSGPAIAKTYLSWAEEAIKGGKAEHLAGLLSKAINEPVAITGDAEADKQTLAKAIAQREKIKRDEQARQSRIELGLE